MQEELPFRLDDPWAGLPKDRFNGLWRAVSAIRECGIAECDTFISRHYLASRPAVVMLCLMMMAKGHPCGVVVYAMPPTECFIRYGGVTWELARLYLLDGIPRNAETWLIGKSVRYIKRHRAGVHALVSYADPNAGHTGVIYRAANWEADGMSNDRTSPRKDYFANGRKYSRRCHVPEGAVAEMRPRGSKHRYVYRLQPQIHDAEQPKGIQKQNECEDDADNLVRQTGHELSEDDEHEIRDQCRDAKEDERGNHAG